MASKGIATVHFPLEEILKFLDEVGSLRKLDDTCIEERAIFEEKDIQVLYFRFSAPWPVSHRDFVMVSYCFHESKDKVYLGSKSCNYNFAEVKGVVRA